MGIIDVLIEPWQYPFMQRAAVVAVVVGVVCGVIGTFVVLRGMAFIGDAVSHAVFPGVVTAYVLGGSLLIGGAVAGVGTAALVALFSQHRRLKEDTLIGVFFAFAFALGIVILSTQTNYTGDLSSFLFGAILALGRDDVTGVIVIGLLLIVAMLSIRKELVAVTLDRETASSSGLPVFKLDMALYVMVALAIVVSVGAVGNILVLALLITPAATARLMTDRLNPMMIGASSVGALGCLLGLTLSFWWDLAAGGLIVVVQTAVFLAAWIFAPRHGLIARGRGERSAGAGESPQPVDVDLR